MNFLKTFLPGLILVLTAGASHAVYRCGNVFQDRPCDGAAVQAGPPRAAAAIAPAAAAESGERTSPFAAACARLGKGAQDIAWRRETGALREDQLLKTASGFSSQEHARLVDAVYARRASSLEIRNAVEAECRVEKQTAADATAAVNALRNAAAGGIGGATDSEPPSSGPNRPAPRAAVANSAPADQAQCANLRVRLAANGDKARAGGDMTSMERLRSERRELEGKLGGTRC